MVSLGTFDSTTVSPETSFELLPPGTYKIRLVDAVEKPTKAGTGTYINLQFEVLEPQQYNGRRVFDILNLNNPSAQAVQISQARLSALVRACGKVTISDTDELIMRPLMAKIKVTPAKDGYEPANKIAEFIFDKDNKPGTTDNTPPPSAATVKPASQPWARV